MLTIEDLKTHGWEYGINKVINGDCLEGMKLIPDGSVDCVITDPPYGTTACSWDTIIPFDKMWEQLDRIVKPNGAIVLFGSEPFSSYLRMSNIKNYKYDWIWEKNQPSGVASSSYMPMKNHEIISIFYKMLPTYNKQPTQSIIKDRKLGNSNGSVFNKTYIGITGMKPKKKNNPKNILLKNVNPRTVIKFSIPPNSKGKLHPTQKPVSLIKYLIKTYTNKNELVLDFTMGSWTTARACKDLNRNFIGFELEKKYCEIGEKRLEQGVMNFSI